MKATNTKSDGALQQLPSGPPSLCFDKDLFMKPEFHVEQFVVECRRRVPLETLRDDLSVYLKILQSAMIELINKDYADFVNLSSNLVGVDKALTSLATPLEQLREEVMAVSSVMDETMSEVAAKMKKQRGVRAKKALLQQLINMVKSVEKIEKLLGLQSSNDSQGPRELTGHLLERVGTEFNKLQFFVNKCRGMPQVEQIRPRMANITSRLQQSLEGWLRDGLDTGNTAVLCQCLRTYATIDKVADAHTLFRQHCVKPYMEEVISEEMVRSEKGLEGMFEAILQFVPQYCKAVLDVTTKSTSGESVQGYDFLVNAVWPEIVCNIEARTPSIFAPGNPKIFHQRYSCSMGLVSRFERLCSSHASIKRLRAHPSFTAFMSKWSLPVYFQIRFQEIAGAFETALNTPFEKPQGSVYQLSATESLVECIEQCWEAAVYLAPLAHRFWKLTLQLVARYSTWMKQVAHEQLPEVVTAQIKPSPSSADLTVNANKAGNGAGDQGAHAMTPSPAPAAPALTMADIVNLLADVHTLTSTKLKWLFTEKIKPHLVELGVQDTTLLEESITDSCSSLEQHVPRLQEYIVAELSSQCTQPLKMVTDIPRLYRRTNREIPSKSSAYVSQVVRPLQAFVEAHGCIVDEVQHKQWLTQVIDNASQSYLSTTFDVLNSVKKMEESLKRLKKGKGSSANLQADGMTDDDKIRLQLYLDVKYLGEQVKQLGIDAAGIEAYTKMFAMVEEASKKAQPDSS